VHTQIPAKEGLCSPVPEDPNRQEETGAALCPAETEGAKTTGCRTRPVPPKPNRRTPPASRRVCEAAGRPAWGR